MDIETIKALVGAGYTKAEILAMSAESANEGAGNEGAGNEGAANESAGNEGAQDVDNTSAETIKALTESVNALKDTVKAMQAKNVNTASGGKAEKDTVDDVMRSFVDAL